MFFVDKTGHVQSTISISNLQTCSSSGATRTSARRVKSCPRIHQTTRRHKTVRPSTQRERHRSKMCNDVDKLNSEINMNVLRSTENGKEKFNQPQICRKEQWNSHMKSEQFGEQIEHGLARLEARLDAKMAVSKVDKRWRAVLQTKLVFSMTIRTSSMRVIHVHSDGRSVAENCASSLYCTFVPEFLTQKSNKCALDRRSNPPIPSGDGSKSSPLD